MVDQNQTDISALEAATATFLDYGVGHIAYVRPIVEESATGFGIFAANGAQIAIAQDSSSAYGFLMEHDLMPISLH